MLTYRETVIGLKDRKMLLSTNKMKASRDLVESEKVNERLTLEKSGVFYITFYIYCNLL